MQPGQLNALADDLWQAKLNGPAWHGDIRSYGNSGLEGRFLQLSLDDGLTLQCEMHRRTLGAGEDQIGYKVGLTSPRAREAIGSDTRPFGHIYKRLSDGATEAFGDSVFSIEPELCFEIGKQIAGENVDPAGIPDCIAGVFAGFEVNEQRLSKSAPLALLVADNLTNWGIVKGKGTLALTPEELDKTNVTLSCNGRTCFEGIASDHVDNPYESLAALAATLNRFDLSLEPGQLVITGAYARFKMSKNPQDHEDQDRPDQTSTAPNLTWRADYSGIGSVELTASRS